MIPEGEKRRNVNTGVVAFNRLHFVEILNFIPPIDYEKDNLGVQVELFDDPRKKYLGHLVSLAKYGAEKGVDPTSTYTATLPFIPLLHRTSDKVRIMLGFIDATFTYGDDLKDIIDETVRIIETCRLSLQYKTDDYGKLGKALARLKHPEARKIFEIIGEYIDTQSEATSTENPFDLTFTTMVRDAVDAVLVAGFPDIAREYIAKVSDPDILDFITDKDTMSRIEELENTSQQQTEESDK